MLDLVAMVIRLSLSLARLRTFTAKLFGSWIILSLANMIPHSGAKASLWKLKLMPLQFGELWFMFWLLIKGANPKPLAGPASSTAVG